MTSLARVSVEIVEPPAWRHVASGLPAAWAEPRRRTPLASNEGIETSYKIPRECNFLDALGETVKRRHGAALLGVEPAEIG